MTTKTQPDLFNATGASTILGELIAWEVPTNTTISLTDLVAALTLAGLDPKAARLLGPRHAFVRACRQLAEQRIIRNLEEDQDHITFQFTAERRDSDQYRYDFEAKLTLDKSTGTITCADAALQAKAEAAFLQCLEQRKTQDITRLLQSLFSRNADLFPIKGGVYFVPQMHVPFLDKVEKFLSTLNGTLARFPVPEGKATVTVQTVVVDGLMAEITEYETAISGLSIESKPSAIRHAHAKVAAAYAKIESYAYYLGGERARLEDHLAWVEHLLQDRTAPLPAPVVLAS